MISKAEFLKDFKSDDTIWASKVFDKIAMSEKTGYAIYPDFLDMYQQRNIENRLKRANIKYCMFGGYFNAERKLLYLGNIDDNYENFSFPLRIIKIEFGKNLEANINHRDILGSILSLGIKREKIGDILLIDNFALCIVHEDISDYILYNLEKVKRYGTKLSITDLPADFKPNINYKEITASIPSLRLDCIVEAGFQIPRSKASQMIENDKVFVNWEVINKQSYQVKAGDIISVRQMGRIIFDEVLGLSKKERNIVKIKKLI